MRNERRMLRRAERWLLRQPEYIALRYSSRKMRREAARALVDTVLACGCVLEKKDAGKRRFR